MHSKNSDNLLTENIFEEQNKTSIEEEEKNQEMQ